MLCHHVRALALCMVCWQFLIKESCATVQCMCHSAVCMVSSLTINKRWEQNLGVPTSVVHDMAQGTCLPDTPSASAAATIPALPSTSMTRWYDWMGQCFRWPDGREGHLSTSLSPHCLRLSAAGTYIHTRNDSRLQHVSDAWSKSVTVHALTMDLRFFTASLSERTPQYKW